MINGLCVCVCAGVVPDTHWLSADDSLISSAVQLRSGAPTGN